MYGPTETTVWSTLTRVDRVDGAIPVGRPIANTGIYILDAHRRALPDGAIGELWVAGNGVADGYQNRPDVTAARFMLDPFAADGRSEERRVGKECVSTGRSRWSP